MKKLVITACARNESNTMRIFKTIQVLKNWDEQDIEILDLYKLVPKYLTEEMLINNVPYQEEIVNHFAKFEEIIIVYPTWNWGIPAILKAYFDLIMIANTTFKIDGVKLIGLTKLKKCTIINTSGFKILPKPIAYLFNINHDRFYVKNMVKILGAKQINIIALGNFGNKKYSNEEIVKFAKTHLHKI